ncbi:hypothetical protein ASPZODRAFT_105672 [Penicilliopsis zonata CBS 506.65]|uniref:LysM domain-containing protein n=1 Tax=Penicilliopsis zonata CBS 506.65 TaxID=1073090 RepID=A0A1L9S4P6_9EURO|nr:hypothetical protein ASPZODRAFT_105672 [Penicilliopsis zonata CBS 506.65]OJJ42140.1 hypothetical protein ASPZODRAFT_105672 [Penicilliopsis zonata CBS 506.65]
MAKLLAALLLLPIALCQQVNGISYSFDRMGLSSSCLDAVNTTVSCPAWLPLHIGFEDATVKLLPEDQLNDLCETPCLDELAALRPRIQSACNASTDVMMPRSIAYPATYIVDRYLYGAKLSCLKDSSTGNYCDVQIAQWNESEPQYNWNCSACGLEFQRIQLGSPFGYYAQEARDFASLTASCGVSGYTYTKPTPYAINASATITATSPMCTASSYSVQKEDTCVTISGAQGVSTFGLIQANQLDLGCFHLAPGQSLCLPPTCQTHQLEMLETCQTLVKEQNITMAQLLAWNPMIDTGCTNLASWRGCSPGGTITVQPADGTATTPAPAPTNAQGQSNHNCGRWYQVQPSDYCAAISVKFHITLNDFYFLNPQVDHDCSNLWLGTSYCVAAVGDISTYPNYPASTASVTFTRPPPPPAFTPKPVPAAPLKPRAPGTVDNCTLYGNALQYENGMLADMMNKCDMWAAWAGVTVAQLIRWNPSLRPRPCVLSKEYSYCMEKSMNVPPFGYCMEPNTTLIPSTSVQPSSCDCYIQFRAADQEQFTCSMFPALFHISVAEVTALNPWLGSDCDGQIWRSMSGGFVQLCVYGT